MATHIPDHYKTLGVGAGAGAQEIRSAYRKLAARYHPDRNPNNRDMEEKFRRISEAYTILSDESNRRKYDAHRHARRAGWEPDLPSGHAPQPSYTYPVADVSLEIELGRSELEQGCLKAVSVSRSRQCPDCRGSGTLEMQGVCDFCRGGGCLRCRGRGYFDVLKCNACWGTGSAKEQTHLVVSVPPGTQAGNRRRFLASGTLWDRVSGMFYVDASVRVR